MSRPAEPPTARSERSAVPAADRVPPARQAVSKPVPRWVAGPANCTDLVDASGRVRGYVGPSPRGVRGYVVQSGSEWPPRPPAFADFPTEEDARAWVAERVERGRQ